MADVIPLPRPDDRRQPSRIFADDERINDLIPGGDELEQQVAFGDMVWDLHGHRSWRDKSGSQTKIDFSGFETAWRDAAKEMALLQLNPSLAPGRAPDAPMAQTWPDIQEPIVPVTGQGNMKMLRHALRIIDQHHITAFDSDDW